MLKEYFIDNECFENTIEHLEKDWKDSKNKVFLFRSGVNGESAKQFYSDFASKFGRFCNYAEDAKEGNRNCQRTGEVWMEIRNDNSIKDAYRHSTNAQPLHTDGSYIPGFPTSLLVCQSNVEKGGETIFVEPKQILADIKDYSDSMYNFVLNVELLHQRSGDSRCDKIFKLQDDLIKVNYNYYCVTNDLPDSIKQLNEYFLNYLVEVEQLKRTNVDVVSVKLLPGDAVIWKDDEVLHGRHSFVAQSDSERFIWKCGFEVDFE